MINIVYLGTPEFSVAPLKKLLSYPDKFSVKAVVTNLDKPVGRKQILTAPPVKTFAMENGIKVLQYKKIRVEGVEELKQINPDIMITCAFGQILSQEILDIPRLGVINVHASLLPKYRGASPIHCAILCGEKKTGVTIMKTDAGIDTGDMILSREVEIGQKETCGELFDKLSVVGADLLIDALDKIIDGTATFIKQDEKAATYTKIFKKEDAAIDFDDTAVNIVNKIRAFNPSPIAFATYMGEPLKIFSADISDGKGNVGEIISADKKIEIACKNGSIIINKLQKAGGKPMLSKDFLLGNRLIKGDILK